MAASTNTFIATGHLTRDPESRRIPSGKEVASFSIAVNGFRDDDTMFLDVETWDKSAAFCMQYLRKGANVLIEARLKQDTWQDSTGQKRSKIKAVANRVQSLDRPQQSNTGYQQPARTGYQQPARTGYQTPPPPFPTQAPAQSDDAFDVSDESIDDIPFSHGADQTPQKNSGQVYHLNIEAEKLFGYQNPNPLPISDEDEHNAAVARTFQPITDHFAGVFEKHHGHNEYQDDF